MNLHITRKIIHIDIDPTSISKTIVVDVPIVGDVGDVLKEILKEAKKSEIGPWLNQIKEWKEKYPMTYQNSKEEIKPQYVIQKISEITKGKAIIATEVGQHQMWTAPSFMFKSPRTLLSSGGLGTMGFGLPASIGAKQGKKKELVFDIAGDEYIQMNIQELATAIAMILMLRLSSLTILTLEWSDNGRNFFSRKDIPQYFLKNIRIMCQAANITRIL